MDDETSDGLLARHTNQGTYHMAYSHHHRDAAAAAAIAHLLFCHGRIVSDKNKASASGRYFAYIEKDEERRGPQYQHTFGPQARHCACEQHALSCRPSPLAAAAAEVWGYFIDRRRKEWSWSSEYGDNHDSRAQFPDLLFFVFLLSEQQQQYEQQFTATAAAPQQ